MTRTFTLKTSKTYDGHRLTDSDGKTVSVGPNKYPPVVTLERLALRLNCKISDLTIDIEESS